MAEIQVERRPGGRRGLLLALLAVVVIAAAAWLLLGRNRGGDTPPAEFAPVDSAIAPADTTPVMDAPDPAPGIVDDDTSGLPPADTAVTL